MLQNGAADYILKPFKIERMKQSLEKYKQYKRRIEENETLSQIQLDMILNMPQQSAEELPKGLNHFTMNEVMTYLKQQKHPFPLNRSQTLWESPGSPQDAISII